MRQIILCQHNVFCLAKSSVGFGQDSRGRFARDHKIRVIKIQHGKDSRPRSNFNTTIRIHLIIEFNFQTNSIVIIIVISLLTFSDTANKKKNQQGAYVTAAHVQN